MPYSCAAARMAASSTEPPPRIALSLLMIVVAVVSKRLVKSGGRPLSVTAARAFDGSTIAQYGTVWTASDGSAEQAEVRDILVRKEESGVYYS